MTPAVAKVRSSRRCSANSDVPAGTRCAGTARDARGRAVRFGVYYLWLDTAAGSAGTTAIVVR